MGAIMGNQKSKEEELQALQEALELQRRQDLASILELQDEGAAPGETEAPRLKLALISQELYLAKSQVNEIGRVKSMGFETAEKIAVMKKALAKAPGEEIKEAVRARDEAEVKVQVLQARKGKFEAQKADMASAIDALRLEIPQILREGGDPSGLNRQLRAQEQEVEDVAGWIGQLEKTTIPEAEKLLSEAQIGVWRALQKLAGAVEPTFRDQMNSLLAEAAEIRQSWAVALREFYRDFRTGKEPAPNSLRLYVDGKRTIFQDTTPWF